MDSFEQKQIIDDILQKRSLSYSIELVEVQGEKYTVRNTFGSAITYIKKGENYFLEEELE